MIKALQKQKKSGFCSAVIVAAGSSLRFGADKLGAELLGKSVLERSLLAFSACDMVDEIILVTREDALEETTEKCKGLKISKLHTVVSGGETRTHSAFAGVSAADRRAKTILIHDAARPLVKVELIKRMIEALDKNVAACPAVSVKDTIKISENDKSAKTLSRDALHAVQTPQAFDADIIKAALTKDIRSGETHTDDCAAAEAMGAPVFIADGDEENIKITTAIDLSVAKAILEARGECL